ncbi:MAG: tetratricopeptide repeat protein [Planctomycetota bacterium]
MAPGQVAGPVDYRVGEANNQIGSGGQNRPIPSGYSANTANLFITGNVTAGRSFQAFSPVRDANTLAIGLPTSLLSDFRRDSVSVDDALRGRTPAITYPYYSRQQTPTSLGTLSAGFEQSGVRWSDSIHALPQQTVAPSLFRFGAPYAPELGWSVFSNSAQVGQLTVQPAAPAQSLSPLGVFGIAAPRPDARLGFVPAALRGPFDPTAPRFQEVGPTEKESEARAGQEPLAQQRPADLLSDSGLWGYTDTDRWLTPEPLTVNLSGEPRQPGSDSTGVTEQMIPAPTTTELSPDPTAVEAQATSPSATEFAHFGRPRADVLEDMVDAYDFISEQQRRGADLAALLKASPTLAAQFQESVTAVRGVTAPSPQTQAGSAESALQQYIRLAEEQLRSGNYYQARSLYQVAGVLDSRHPLVFMGQGHAMLAAGEYHSAALKLSRAVELFPAMAFFKLDLTGFITEPDLLEKRRADLEQRLERREDYRLRFVLGYAEFYSGLEKYGLENLRQAAEEAPEHSGISRLYELVTTELPELPTADPE